MLPKNVPQNVGTTRKIDDSDASTYSDNLESQSDMNQRDDIRQREINGIISKSNKTKKRKGSNKESAKTVTLENVAPSSLSERAPGLYSNLQTYISSRNTTSKRRSSVNKDNESSTHVPKSKSPLTELNTSELRDNAEKSNDSRSHTDDIVDSSILEYYIGDLRVGDILGTSF